MFLHVSAVSKWDIQLHLINLIFVKDILWRDQTVVNEFLLYAFTTSQT